MHLKKAYPVTKKTRIKFIYPAQQFELSENPRPDGSLGILYLASILRDHGYYVEILDMCVGDESDSLEETFYNRVPFDESHVRVGLPLEKLESKIRGFDIVGITSIFTPQTLNCYETARKIKEINPGIITLAGGGNARALYKQFLDNGFDIVAFGEAEQAMLELADSIEEGKSWKNILNFAYQDNGQYCVNPERAVVQDLDELPIPAWDLLPLSKYWKIGEPHGGTFEPGQEVRYLSMQTSRGCPFSCSYCHISKENDAGKLRFKSIDRVEKEIDIIKGLGAEYLFFEDDSLLAKPARVKEIFNRLKGKNLKIIDVNGVNLAHFFKHGDGKDLVVDEELIDLMIEVGWVEIAYPFESGCQRILDKYASRKWNKARHDVLELVRISIRKGLKISGFFTIGYPDETYEELTETYLFAKELIEAGLSIAAFYIITPYPGSKLYDYAVANGHVPQELDLVNMKFAVPTMKNILISPDVLRYTRKLVYQLLNSRKHIQVKHSKNIGTFQSQNDGARASKLVEVEP